MYAKIFQQIFDSSLADDYLARYVFVDFLVLANSDGVVDMTPEAISRRTNVPLKIVRNAIETLEAKDPRSRSPEFGGARIKRLDDHRDWGWVIVNYDRYRDMATEQNRKEKTRERVRKYRAARDSGGAESERNGTPTVTPCNADVPKSNDKEKKKDLQTEMQMEEGKKEGASAPLPPAPEPISRRDIAQMMIDHLNSETGRTGAERFHITQERIATINARVKEIGDDLEGMKVALSRKVKEWINDPEMAQHLSPDTLFRPSKFLKYYESRNLPIPKPYGSNQSTGKPNPRNFGIPPTDNLPLALARIARDNAT